MTLMTEYKEDNTRIRFYSDEGFYIVQNETGIMYEDAEHNVPTEFTYTETDVKIEYEQDGEINDPETE